MRTPSTYPSSQSSNSEMLKQERITILEKKMKKMEKQIDQIKKRLKQLDGSY